MSETHQLIQFWATHQLLITVLNYPGVTDGWIERIAPLINNWSVIGDNEQIDEHVIVWAARR